MALTKEQKRKIIEALKEKIAKQKAMVFVDFTGLKVNDLSDLRKKIKVANCELKVAKKTLMRIAFKQAKIPIETKKLRGEIALVFGYREEILPAKIVWQFSQGNQNLKILGGFFENKFRQLEEIISLAQLPTREELLARLVGSLQAPISNLVNVFQGNIKGLIFLLTKIRA